MAKFEVDLYRRYRIAYPPQLFEVVKPYCLRPANAPLQVLDLGAGTGLASLSFLQFYPHAEITLVEPDADMLSEAEESLKNLTTHVQAVLSPAETYSSLKQFDLVLIASAWHWMQAGPVLDTLLRVLKPGGVILVCEYQFPKLVNEQDAPQLNEWVRRQFNLHWRTQVQVPRGSLFELVVPFRQSGNFSQVGEARFDHHQLLHRDTFLGVIFSQSRYLDFEKRLSGIAQTQNRKVTDTELQSVWNGFLPLAFHYQFQSYLFQKRYF